MAKTNSDTLAVPDGSMDFSDGVDSSKVTTLASDLQPNGLKRTQLAWLFNASLRFGGILQRTGWQPLLHTAPMGSRWQGGFMYEPDNGNPYLVCSIDGHILQVLLEPPYGVTDLSAAFGLVNPANAEMAWFVQGENYLIIQAGDYYTNPTADPTGYLGGPSPTLPLFWNGTTLRRSIGIQTLTPTMTPGQNEIPAAAQMDYYGNRIWYGQGRQISGGDMAGGPSGTAGNHFRDAILNVTENPLCFGGDGFSLPTNAGNIRAIKHSASLNASLGQGQLFIFTRKSVYMLTVPVTRTDWIGADRNNQPQLTVVQLVNGTVSDRSVVAVNGDLFYQSFDPAIRSLITAVRYFDQWGNTPISQNEQRALQLNDRALMRFSGGIEFDNRVLQLVMPKLAADGINVVHQAVLPLDFDIITSLEARKPPVWEGAYDGLPFLQLFNGDFGGLPRGFGVVISEVDSSIDVWELTTANTRENGDNRVTWGAEFPAFTWSHLGLELKLKQLNGGECWIDKVRGTVDMDVYYREDADPCWRFWMHTQFCAARDCQEQESPCIYPYPGTTFREGYVFPVVFPEPKPACDSMGIRPTTIGYQFQVKIILKGWCRIRGLLLYALPREKPQFQGIACPPTGIPQGMAKLPNPFA